MEPSIFDAIALGRDGLEDAKKNGQVNVEKSTTTADKSA